MNRIENINYIIEFVDYIFSTEEYENNKISNLLNKEKKLSLKEQKKKNKKKYMNAVNTFTKNVKKELIEGYNEERLLTNYDINNNFTNFHTSDKLVIDHKISKSFGFENNIAPEIISDISNLRYIESKINTKKNKKNFIDEKNKWILYNIQINQIS